MAMTVANLHVNRNGGGAEALRTVLLAGRPTRATRCCGRCRRETTRKANLFRRRLYIQPIPELLSVGSEGERSTRDLPPPKCSRRTVKPSPTLDHLLSRRCRRLQTTFVPCRDLVRQRLQQRSRLGCGTVPTSVARLRHLLRCFSRRLGIRARVSTPRTADLPAFKRRVKTRLLSLPDGPKGRNRTFAPSSLPPSSDRRWYRRRSCLSPGKPTDKSAEKAGAELPAGFFPPKRDRLR